MVNGLCLVSLDDIGGKWFMVRWSGGYWGKIVNV